VRNKKIGKSAPCEISGEFELSDGIFRYSFISYAIVDEQMDGQQDKLGHHY